MESCRGTVRIDNTVICLCYGLMTVLFGQQIELLTVNYSARENPIRSLF